MKTPLLASLLVSVVGSLAACGASFHATAVNPAPHVMAPRPVESVEMFTSGAPTRPHVDVALLEVEEASSLSTARTPQLLAKLRTQAAQMGCDGVVLGGASSRDPGVNDAESWINNDAKGRHGFIATCIDYTP